MADSINDIEILLTATDLASGDLNKAANDIENRLDALSKKVDTNSQAWKDYEAQTQAAAQALRDLEAESDKFNTSSDSQTKSIKDLESALDGIANKFDELVESEKKATSSSQTTQSLYRDEKGVVDSLSQSYDALNKVRLAQAEGSNEQANEQEYQDYLKIQSAIEGEVDALQRLGAAQKEIKTLQELKLMPTDDDVKNINNESTAFDNLGRSLSQYQGAVEKYQHLASTDNLSIEDIEKELALRKESSDAIDSQLAKLEAYLAAQKNATAASDAYNAALEAEGKAGQESNSAEALGLLNDLNKAKIEATIAQAAYNAELAKTTQLQVEQDALIPNEIAGLQRIAAANAKINSSSADTGTTFQGSSAATISAISARQQAADQEALNKTLDDETAALGRIKGATDQESTSAAAYAARKKDIEAVNLAAEIDGEVAALQRINKSTEDASISAAAYAARKRELEATNLAASIDAEVAALGRIGDATHKSIDDLQSEHAEIADNINLRNADFQAINNEVLGILRLNQGLGTEVESLAKSAAARELHNTITDRGTQSNNSFVDSIKNAVTWIGNLFTVSAKSGTQDDQTISRKEKLENGLDDLGNAFRTLFSRMSVILVAIPAVASALGILGAGAYGLVGGIGSLIGPLGDLAGGLAVIPALAAAAGAGLAGALGVGLPAFLGISKAVTALNQNSLSQAEVATGAKGSTSTTGAGSPADEADKGADLANTERTSTAAVTAAETALTRARLAGAQSVADAEKSSSRSRVDDVQKVKDAETTLAQLQTKNAQDVAKENAAYAVTQANDLEQIAEKQTANNQAAIDNANQLSNALQQQTEDNLTREQNEATAIQNISEMQTAAQQKELDLQNQIDQIQQNATNRQLQGLRDVANVQASNAANVLRAQRELAAALAAQSAAATQGVSDPAALDAAVAAAQQHLQNVQNQSATNVAGAQQNAQSAGQLTPDEANQVSNLQTQLSQQQSTDAQNLTDAETSLAQLKAKDAQDAIDQQTKINQLVEDNNAQEAKNAQDLADLQTGYTNDQATHLQNLQDIQNQYAIDNANDVENLANAKTQQQRDEADGIEALKKAQTDAANSVADAQTALDNARADRLNSLRNAQVTLTNAETGASDAGTKANDLLAAQLSKLSPLQITVAKQILAMKDAWDKLTASAQNNALEFVETVIQSLNKDMPTVAGYVDTFAASWVSLGTDLLKMVNSPYWDKVFGSLAVDANANFLTLGQTIIALGQTLLLVMKAAAPLTTWMIDSVKNFADLVLGMTKTGTASGALAGYFDKTKTVLSTVAHIVGNILTTLYHLGQLGGSTGEGLLKAFEGVTANWAKLTDPKSADAAGITKFFQDSVAPLKIIGGLLGDIVKMIISVGQRVASNKEFMGDLQDMGKKGGLIDQLGNSIVTLTTQFGPTFLKFLSQLFQAMGAVAGDGGPLSDLIKGLTGLLDIFNDMPPGAQKVLLELIASVVLWMKVIKPLHDVLISLPIVGDAFNLLFTPIKNLTKIIAIELGGALDSIVTKMGSVITKAGEMGSSLAKNTGSIAKTAGSALKSKIGSSGSSAAVSDAEGAAEGGVGAAVISKGGAALTFLKGFASDAVGILEDILVVLGEIILDALAVLVEALGGWLVTLVVILVAAIAALVIKFHNQVLDGLKMVWDAIKMAAKDALIAIGIFVGLLLAPILLVIKYHKDMENAVVDAWNFIVGAISDAWNAIVAFFTNAGPDFVAAIKAIWSGIKDAIKDAWTGSQSILSELETAWGAILKWTEGLPDDMVSAFHKIWKAVGDAIAFEWNLGPTGILSQLKTAWSGILSWADGLPTDFKAAIMTVWVAVENDVQDAWDGGKNGGGIKGALNSAWGAIQKWPATVSDAFVGAVNDIWNSVATNVKDAWGDGKGAILWAVNNAWSLIVDTFNIAGTAATLFTGAILTIWGAVESGIKDTWAAILSKVESVFTPVLNFIVAGVNDIIKGINIVLNAVNLTPIDQINGGNAYKAADLEAKAEGGMVQTAPGGVYRVAEAGYPEMVLTTDPKHKKRTAGLMGQMASMLGIPSFATGGLVMPSGPNVVDLVKAAIAQIGKPYVWGGTGPEDFDCSGLMQYIFKQIGISSIPRTSELQAQWTNPVSTPVIGDLVFFDNLDKANDPNDHVGLVVDPGKNLMIVAPTTGENVQQQPYTFAPPHFGAPPGLNFNPFAGDSANPVTPAAASSALDSAISSILGTAVSGGSAVSDFVTSLSSNFAAYMKKHIPSMPKVTGLSPELDKAFGKMGSKARKDLIGWVKGQIPHFADGGEVLGGTLGSAKQVMAHVGEWVLNPQQQAIAAQPFGGVANLKSALFSTSAAPYAFATGGLAGVSAAPAMTTPTPSPIINLGPINTTQPDIDIDYIASKLQRRMDRNA